MRTTKQVKKQFGEMSAQMQEKMHQQQNTYNSTSSARQEKTSGTADDYIEFEEVKK